MGNQFHLTAISFNYSKSRPNFRSPLLVQFSNGGPNYDLPDWPFKYQPSKSPDLKGRFSDPLCNFYLNLKIAFSFFLTKTTSILKVVLSVFFSSRGSYHQSGGYRGGHGGGGGGIGGPMDQGGHHHPSHQHHQPGGPAAATVAAVAAKSPPGKIISCAFKMGGF